MNTSLKQKRSTSTVATAIAGLTLAMTLAGCGGASASRSDGSDKPSTSPHSTSLQKLPPPSTTTSTVPSDPLTTSWTMNASTPSGYTMTAILRIGSPERYRPGLRNSAGDPTGNGITAGSSCQLSSQTDTVIPAELTITNTTPTYDAPIGLSVIGIRRFRSLLSITSINPVPSLSFEGQFSDGSTCKHEDGTESGSELSVVSANNLAPNKFIHMDGFFEIKNYYSPSHPEGNSSLLKVASFEIVPASNAPATFNWLVGTGSGPGLQIVYGAPKYLQVDLDGTGPIPCVTTSDNCNSPGGNDAVSNLVQ